ncbi:hypothetical protein OMES3154_01288 [Oceanivirga miroungae]|uniref:Uncharacterized protein n=2 Tax=Oceanivirga miroungae TaxID=1130046 RepID=A0A6I8MFB2_9FUSO|nr:hypothetical protein OMES3154_01288 [Oceanivirga miroungae]
MAVGKQIKTFSNFKTQSSKNSGTKNSVSNIANEYERIGEQKNKDINHNLSSENLILKKFDIKEYEKIIENTDYNLNSKNSKYEDIYSTTPTIQATNFVNLGGINLTFLMEKDEWVEYYKDLSDFIKDYMGDSFITLSEVIQFDEFTPHLQLMGIFRSEVSNETLANKNLEEDPKLFEEISRKQFTRYNNKLKGTDDYVDPKNKKEYKEAKIKWVEENKENIIKNYKPRNKTTEKKYAYIRNDNPFAIKKNSYKDYQNKLYEFNKEHKFIKKLCEKATEIRGEEVLFVKNSTEPVYDGKSKNHYEIKETIERENKEIEYKIQNGIDLTENEVYRYIRKQNREKLKQEFLELDRDTWKNKFKEPQNPQYDFNLKLSNDYIKIAKEIAYKPYIELESQKEEINKDINNLKTEKKQKSIELEDIKKETYDFYKYTDTNLIRESKNILDNIEPQKTMLGKLTGNYILTGEQKDKIYNIVQTRLYTNDDLIKANRSYKNKKDKELEEYKTQYRDRKDKEVKDLLENISDQLNDYSKKIFGISFNIDLYSQRNDIVYNVLNNYSMNYELSEKTRLEELSKNLEVKENELNLEKENFENTKETLTLENKNIKENLEELSDTKAELIAKNKLNEYIENFKLNESNNIKENLLSEIKLSEDEKNNQKDKLKREVKLYKFEILEKKSELLSDIKITDKDINKRKKYLRSNVKLDDDEIKGIKNELSSKITLSDIDIEDYKNKLLEEVKEEYINELKTENKELLEISKEIGIVDNTIKEIKDIKELIAIKKDAEELVIDNFIESYYDILEIAKIYEDDEIYNELSNVSMNTVDSAFEIKVDTEKMKYEEELKEYGKENISLISFVTMNVMKVVAEVQTIMKNSKDIINDIFSFKK